MVALLQTDRKIPISVSTQSTAESALVWMSLYLGFSLNSKLTNNSNLYIDQYQTSCQKLYLVINYSKKSFIVLVPRNNERSPRCSHDGSEHQCDLLQKHFVGLVTVQLKTSFQYLFLKIGKCLIYENSSEMTLLNGKQKNKLVVFLK